MEHEEYLVDSNKALAFGLVRYEGDMSNEDLLFSPEMSHQVFGERETLFGYRSPKIEFFYSCGKLHLFIQFGFEDRCEDDAISADDVFKLLAPFIRHDYTLILEDFKKELATDHEFTPYGTLLYSFTVKDGDDTRTFCIYVCDTSDKNFIEYHQRMETFIIWYIDAASYIQSDDDRWKFFVIYEKFANEEYEKEAYAFVGYTTVYEYYAYPSNIRPRISQVLVLPPFQGFGICAELLVTIYKFYKNIDTVTDITVEDPAENFQRVRDFVDCSYCLTLPEFSDEALLGGFNEDMAKAANVLLNLNTRQVKRVFDVLLLKITDMTDETANTEYRAKLTNKLLQPYEQMSCDAGTDTQRKHMSRGNRRRSVGNQETLRAEAIAAVQGEVDSLIDQFQKVIARLNIFPLAIR